MGHLLAFALMIALVGSAAAVDLGALQKDFKTDNHVGLNPGAPDGREGGEDMATAMSITSLPFADSGNTFDNVDDYDVVCPYTGSTSPDVVYSFTTPDGGVYGNDMFLSVDLCGSSYDTKVYIMDGDLNVIECNDDAYFDDVCGIYVSAIEFAILFSSTEYFIVVDGYGGDAGDYLIDVVEFIGVEPCMLSCEDSVLEGEPELHPDYQDAFNGGCDSPEFGEPWGDLTMAADANGDLDFCGNSGWTDAGRDTDWNYLMIGEYGVVEMVFEAERPTTIYILTMTTCDDVVIDQSMTVGRCGPQTMIIQGNPGEVIMLWIGPTELTPPDDFYDSQYVYLAFFSGLADGGTTATENVSLDGIKSLYR